MSIEESFVATAVANWKNTLDRAEKALRGLDSSGLEKQVAPERNRAIYLWGHLAATHDRMIVLLGIGDRVRPDLDEFFLTSPDRSKTLPPVEEIVAWWDQVSKTLNEGIASLSTSQWLEGHTAVSAEDFEKDKLRNRFSILLTRTGHLGYHLGQLALLSK